MSAWLELAKEQRQQARGSGANMARARRSIDEFCSWAVKENIEFPAELGRDAERLAEFEKTLDLWRDTNGKLKRDGQSCMTWAEQLMKLSREKAREVEAAAADEPDDETLSPTEDDEDMARQHDEEEFDETDEQDEAEQDEQDEQDDPAPARRKKTQPRPVIVVDPRVLARASAKPKGRAAANPRSQIKGFESAESVRITKRDETGHVVNCDTYSVQDLDGMDVKSFIVQVVAPLFMNEDGSDTVFTAYRLSPSGQTLGQPAQVTIEGDGERSNAPTDPFSQLTRAFDVVDTVKERFAPQPKSDPMLDTVKQKALMGGDMNTALMLMMMEKLSQPRNSEAEIVAKVLAHLEKQQQGPAFPMMPMAPPPMPAQDSASSKLIDMAIAKMVQGGPSMMEQMREMAAIKEFMGAGRNESPEMAALRGELQALRSQLTGSKKGGLEETLSGFEQITTLVKSLAPQVVGDTGGFGGFLKSMLTPDVGRAIASAVAGGAGQAQVQPAVQVQPTQGAPTPAAQPAQPQPAQPPMPKEVLEAEAAIKLAQTTPARAERFAQLIIAMYQSQHPMFMQHLQPVLEKLMSPVVGVAELAPARAFVFRVVVNMNEEWGTPEFADAVLAALAAATGLTMPDALVQTRGAWFVDYRGRVVMLQQAGVQPVGAGGEAQPQGTAAPGAEASPTSSAPPAPDAAPTPPARPTPKWAQKVDADAAADDERKLRIKKVSGDANMRLGEGEGAAAEGAGAENSSLSHSPSVIPSRELAPA